QRLEQPAHQWESGQGVSQTHRDGATQGMQFALQPVTVRAHLIELVEAMIVLALKMIALVPELIDLALEATAFVLEVIEFAVGHIPLKLDFLASFAARRQGAQVSCGSSALRELVGSR